MTAEQALVELERTGHNHVPMCVYSLARRVLAVAARRIEGWCAYINAVPGKDHQAEALPVMDSGDKLAEPVARAMFPQFANLHYCR